MEAKQEKIKSIVDKLGKYKYVVLIALVGLVLILLPSSGGDSTDGVVKTSDTGITVPDFSLADEEERLCQTLAAIDGVGECRVLLSLRSGTSRELADDEDGTLVISSGSGTQEAVELRYVYPEYLGATVVCTGADSANVRLDVTEAVKAFTGLQSNKITVIKMK